MHKQTIKQRKMKIEMYKYTVDWLVNNTKVKVFDPITFKGYQRKIDDNHARKIVKYIMDTEFYFPTSIICSIEELTNEDSKLSIVDGQHRIEAFKIIKEEYIDKYDEIKDYEIPVIILVSPDEKDEIETFITINKTSKTVDTSLAYVLKNMKNKNTGSSDDIDISKREYMAVEVAKKLNDNKEYSWWFGKISYEGPTKNTYELITLNAFVKSMRAYLNHLEKCGVISCQWTNSDEIDEQVNKVADLIQKTWTYVYEKWPEIDNTDNEDRRIIQGPIGFTTLNRYMITILKENDMRFTSVREYTNFLYKAIYDISVKGTSWKKGELYSKFTSESGYRAILDDLLKDSSCFIKRGE